MSILKQISFTSAFIFALLSTAFAQDSNSASAQRSSLTITAAATGERVRIAAPSSVVQMHVEVYAAGGERLFDQEIRGGNVFDWHLQDGQAQRLAPGDYVCVVTVKSISGKLTQKIGTVSVAEKSASVQPADARQLSAAQAQPIGPVEENSSWTIAAPDEPQTGTVIAHDGTDGQMIRGRGALTFRIGNFFSGIDTEQMRLTEAGNLGIGTSEPRAKLEVAGTIRAERFLVTKPNQRSSDALAGNSAPSTDAVDSVQPLVAGTGTTDRIAKWTDNAGTLGNSAITETGGNVGIGTTTPTQALEVANGRIVTSGSKTLTGQEGILEIGTTVTNNNTVASGIRMRNLFNGNAPVQQALDVAPTFAPSASITRARGFVSAAFFAPPAGVTITDAYGGNAVNVYNATSGAVTNGTAFALNSPVAFGSLKPTNQYGLRINNQGLSGTTNSYGLFVDAQSGSTNNYSAVFDGGTVGIGTVSPNGNLIVRGSIFAGYVSKVPPEPGFGPGIAVDAETNSGGEAVYAECLQSGNNCYALEGYAPAGDYAGYLYGGKGVYAESDDASQPGVDANAYGSNSYAVHAESAAYRGGYVKSDSGVLYSLYVDTAGGPTQATAALNVRGAVNIEGNLYVAGSKSGFVVDIMQNVDNTSLEPGDVVVLTGNAPPVLGQIPVVTVKKATGAYDTAVAGVVDEVWYAPDPNTKAAYQTQESAARAAMDARNSARAATRVSLGKTNGVEQLSTRRLKSTEPEIAMPIMKITDEQGTLHSLPGVTSVGPGGYLSVVTLGAYKIVKVDASFGAIRAGDLLTTSTHAGYAMKVNDKVAAIGAIIGKALGDLDSGTGTIPVLVMPK